MRQVGNNEGQCWITGTNAAISFALDFCCICLFNLLSPFPFLLAQRRKAAVYRMGRDIVIKMCGNPNPARSVFVTLALSSAMIFSAKKRETVPGLRYPSENVALYVQLISPPPVVVIYLFLFHINKLPER